MSGDSISVNPGAVASATSELTSAAAMYAEGGREITEAVNRLVGSNLGTVPDQAKALSVGLEQRAAEFGDLQRRLVQEATRQTEDHIGIDRMGGGAIGGI